MASAWPACKAAMTVKQSSGVASHRSVAAMAAVSWRQQWPAAVWRLLAFNVAMA